jgi:hypothetical protein
MNWTSWHQFHAWYDCLDFSYSYVSTVQYTTTFRQSKRKEHKMNLFSACPKYASALSESPPLPTDWSTWQSLKNTRQRLYRVSHSAKKARHTVHRQSLLCRVLFLGHLAKRFAECQGSLGKEKTVVTTMDDGDSVFAECPGWHSAKKLPLPSVTCDTRQRTRSAKHSLSSASLYRVYCTR